MKIMFPWFCYVSILNEKTYYLNYNANMILHYIKMLMYYYTFEKLQYFDLICFKLPIETNTSLGEICFKLVNNFWYKIRGTWFQDFKWCLLQIMTQSQSVSIITKT